MVQAGAECAARLCQASDSVIVLKRGSEMVYAAHHGEIGVRPDGAAVPLSRGLASGRALVDCAQVHVLDVQAEGGDFPEASENGRAAGSRTILATPMLRDGAAMGAVVPDEGVVGEGGEGETVVVGAGGWGVADTPGVQAPRSATITKTIGPNARVTVPA